MGIKDFFTLYNGPVIYTGINDLSGSTIAIDTMNYLYRIKAVIKCEEDKFTDIFSKSIVSFIKNAIINNVSLIYVFDGSPHIIKSKCLSCREKNKETLRVTSGDIALVKKILIKFSVPYIDFVDFYDAEHICAQLQMKGLVNHIMSNDADCFLYGANSILKSVSGKYRIYESKHFTSNGNQISRYDLVRIGVSLGSDFANKVPGIGPKTVINKLNSITFDEEQMEAIKYFYSNISNIKEIYNVSMKRRKPIDIKNLEGFLRGIGYKDQFIDTLMLKLS